MTSTALRAEVLRRLREIGPRSVTASVVAHYGGEHLPTAAVWGALEWLWEAEMVTWEGEQTYRLVVQDPSQLRMDIAS